MPTLREQIDAAYKTAMKARDEIGVRTLRLLNSDLRKLEVDERKTASEDEVLQILLRSIKKRKEAVAEAEKLQRADVAASETAELKVLEQFLPKQMTEPELVAVVEDTIREVGASTKKDQGKVMGALMPKIQGKADGRLASKLVGERLT
ncbi:MAG TPA: GatB/YqeY domain-containing protein [Planctomycetota bacterium]|nr:GatB/YqeY domain-containing protein [Planctomycetota bacterium]